MVFLDIIERIGAILKLANGIEDHVIYDQLGDLRLEAYDLKTQVLELKEENRVLKEQIADAGKRTLDKECYYFNGDGPFCTCCYDSDGKKIRMHESDNNMGTKFNKCPKCGLKIKKEQYPFEFSIL